MRADHIPPQALLPGVRQIVQTSLRRMERTSTRADWNDGDDTCHYLVGYYFDRTNVRLYVECRIEVCRLQRTLKTYETEFSKDPGSPATESSRSNLVALRHTINQIYGEAVALEFSDSLSSAPNALPPTGQAS